MPENRFYFPEPFSKGEIITLEKEELKHLRVMRKTPGDTIELVNGKNELAQGKIQTLTKTSSTAIIETLTKTPPPKNQTILALALLRPKNLDLVIEKGTELGATAFHLFPGERSEKQTLSENQLQRLRHLSISALKQCGRLDLPSIQLMPPLTSWSPPPGKLYYGDLAPNAPPLSPTQSNQAVFIGPEKGFSENELEILRNTLKSSGIRLGPHILRAETAALCAIAQMTHF